MSSYGASSSEVREARKELPKLNPSELFFGPWVLVPEGSLLGFFDWVPKNLRVGSWSLFAAPTLALLTAAIIYSRPEGDVYLTDPSSYPELWSVDWWYNASTCLLMNGLIVYIVNFKASIGAVATFTILSWLMNAARHGINALAPFLDDGHLLLKLNHISRFPSLASASLTFTIWNAVLFPYILLWILDDAKKRKGFIIWNFNPRMTQLHVCNMIYALLNTAVTGRRHGSLPQPFDYEDLWYGMAYGLCYGLFYTLILDRLGVHIYPIFSPRSSLVVISWLGVFASYYFCYQFWNYVISYHENILSLSGLLGLNFVIIVCCAIIQWLFSRK